MTRHGDNNPAYKHGHAPRAGRAPEYAIWKGMRMRCAGRQKNDVAGYAKRGITVCERWDDYATFISDMGPRPSSEHSIDRIDNDKGYGPDNCRWATRQEQGRNKRNNVLVTIGTKTQALSAWAEQFGIEYYNVHQRIHKLGWTPERAITTPVARP